MRNPIWPAKKSGAKKACQDGLSLIELMVGMVIGLFGIMIIANVLIVNDNYKRQTVGSSNAAMNGAIGLYTMERDIRMAGHGIANSGALGCTQIQWYWDEAPIGPVYSAPQNTSSPLPTLALVPVLITDGGASASDKVQVMYSATARPVPTTIRSAMPPSSSELNVESTLGFSRTPGDMVVISQGTNCTLMQVTQVQASAQKLQGNPGGSAPYNPSGAGFTSPAGGYTAGANVFNLGVPIVHIYSVANGNLMLQDVFSVVTAGTLPTFSATANPIMNDIVDLKAQYGKDNGVDNSTVSAASFAANDGRVDQFSKVTPVGSTEWSQVLSVRLAVLARNAHYNKPTTGTDCDATTIAPKWANGTQDFSVNFAAGSEARCYKYSVFELVVPLRNMIWRES